MKYNRCPTRTDYALAIATQMLEITRLPELLDFELPITTKLFDYFFKARRGNSLLIPRVAFTRDFESFGPFLSFKREGTYVFSHQTHRLASVRDIPIYSELSQNPSKIGLGNANRREDDLSAFSVN
jgi:hypothetical protein